jgi:hypothetical protein
MILIVVQFVTGRGTFAWAMMCGQWPAKPASPAVF